MPRQLPYTLDELPHDSGPLWEDFAVGLHRLRATVEALDEARAQLAAAQQEVADGNRTGRIEAARLLESLAREEKLLTALRDWEWALADPRWSEDDARRKRAEKSTRAALAGRGEKK